MEKLKNRPRVSWMQVLMICGVIAFSSATSATAAKLITTKQIKNGAVTSAKIKDGTITAKDIKSGVLKGGPAGAKGEKGARGDAGPQGAAGADGAQGHAGASGVAAVSTVRNGETIPGGEPAVVTASCPAGAKAVSGYGRWTGGPGYAYGTQEKTFYSSQPTNDGSGWLFSTDNLLPSDQYFEVTAICVGP